MSLLIGLGEPLIGHVGVNLGCAQGRMSEEFLDAPQIGATVQQVGRCGVTERVRSQRTHARHISQQGRNDLVDASRSDGLACGGKKNSGRASFSDELWPTLLDVASQCSESGGTQGDDPLLIAFTEHPHRSAREVHSLWGESHEFAHSNRTGV